MKQVKIFESLEEVVEHLKATSLPGKPIDAPISEGLEPDPEPGGKLRIHNNHLRLDDTGGALEYREEVNKALWEALRLLGVDGVEKPR